MEKRKIITPSVIAKSQEELENGISKVKDYTNLLQLDVMDGKFVSEVSLNFNFKLPKINKEYEVHLMIENPEHWINKNWKKVQRIIFHFESCESSKEVRKIIKLIKSKKRKVGIAVNPKTALGRIKPYLNSVNMILVMTVNQGKYGRKFIPYTLKKVSQLRKLKPNLNIEVDGGINSDTISLVSEAGANMFVPDFYSGDKEDTRDNIKRLSELI